MVLNFDLIVVYITVATAVFYLVKKLVLSQPEKNPCGKGACGKKQAPATPLITISRKKPTYS